jgi:hypothetical protein
MKHVFRSVIVKMIAAGIATVTAAVWVGFILIGHSAESRRAGTTSQSVVFVDAKPQQLKQHQKYIILACDGGGVRGALTARIVQGIEDELKKASNQGKFSFCDRVDCFAGTSTGGLIALGLASGKTPEEVVSIYGDEKKWGRIFTKYKPTDEMATVQGATYRLAKVGLATAEERLKKVIDPGWSEGVDSLFFTRYDSSGVREIVGEALGERRKQKLADLAPKRSVVVTTLWLGEKTNGMKIDAWRPMILHNLPRQKKAGKMGSEDAEKDDQTARDAKLAMEMTILDAALCTSAAPTYFPPHRIEKVGCFADGGVFANNPGIAALSMAIRAGIQLQDIHIISVGTGSFTNYMKVPPWKGVDPKLDGKYCGVMAWLLPTRHDGVPETPLISAIFDAGAAADETYCKAILGDRYRRIQVSLKQDIDLANKDAVPGLITLAEEYIGTPAWNEHKAWLRKTIE